MIYAAPIALILVVVVSCALGVYFGLQHGREQRELLRTERDRYGALLDEYIDVRYVEGLAALGEGGRL
jgi:hypothetical protein